MKGVCLFLLSLPTSSSMPPEPIHYQRRKRKEKREDKPGEGNEQEERQDGI